MTWLSWLRRLAILGMTVAATLVAFLAVLLVLQPTLDLTPFKHRFERQLTDLVGVPVRLREVYLRTSLRPEVQVKDLHVAELVSIETSRLQIELIPLLQRRISIDSLAVDLVALQLRPAIELATDWFEEENQHDSPYRFDALEHLEFDRVQVNVTDNRGTVHRLVIDELDGSLTRTSPLRLVALGSFAGQPLQLETQGPTLEAIVTPTSPLPLAARLEIADASLAIEGSLERAGDQPSLAADFAIDAEDLRTTLAAVDLGAPSLGPLRLRGRLTHSGGPVRVSLLEGSVGGSELHGELELRFEEEQPVVSGGLDVGRIDLQPWLEARPAAESTSSTEAGAERTILDRPLPATSIDKFFSAIDTDLEITVNGVDGWVTSAESLQGRLLLRGGRLTLPYALQLADAPVRGELEVAGAEGAVSLSIELRSTRLPIDRLTRDLGQGLVTGNLGELEVSAASSGSTLGEILNRLVLEVGTEDAGLRFRSPDASRYVDLILTHMELRRGPDLPFELSLDGDLRGYPYRVELSGQRIENWQETEPWPFSLLAQGLGNRTRIDGRLSLERRDRFLVMELDVSGDRIGDLEPWWGVPADADYPYALQGNLFLDADRLELNLDDLRIGQTVGSLSLLAPPVEREPVQVTFQASVLDLDQLLQLLESEDKALTPESELTIDVPIFPGELKLPDTRLHVELDRLARDGEALSDLTAVSADIEILQSHLERITFSGRADEATFQGRVGFDWQLEPATMNLELTGESLDLGRLVSLEPIAPGLVVRSRHLDLQVTGAERTLRQMFLEGVEISGRAEGVFLSLPSFDETELFELTLDEAQLSSSPERLLVVEAMGHLRDWPVDLRLTVDNRVGAGLEDDHLPIDLVLETGDVRLQTRGRLTLPAVADTLDLEFDLSADRVSSFEPFTGHRVSEVGPVAAVGQLAIRPDRFAVRDLSVHLGQSDAGGELTLHREGPRPRLVAQLSSQRLHLAELFAHTESPNEDPTAPPAEATRRAHESSSTTEEVSWLERLQSSRLAKLDLDLNLQSEDIYWGGEHGGRGQIEVRSEAGRLIVEPFQLALAAGSVAARAEVLADADRLDVDMELQLYDVEYGPLLRYFNQDAKGSGIIDLETRVAASSTAAGELIKASNGDFRFALFPRNIDTTLINFWGAGLFSSMIRVVDPADESVLNCIMGDFQLTDGQMTSKEFWFDTSRVRARGKGSIDLVARTIDMKLHPRPKMRTLLTLATPARIKGPLEKPKISLTTGGLVGTAFRLYMWWLTIYTQVLKKPLPKDGSDVCFLPLPVETVEEPSAVTASPPID